MTGGDVILWIQTQYRVLQIPGYNKHMEACCVCVNTLFSAQDVQAVSQKAAE